MQEEPVQAARDLFIRRWGEMAASWGISRTMAEIHALLYMATEPFCTDDIMEQLAVSRGSASMNLRELVKWGLIERVHRRGDRKEYFEAEQDVWQMFETIVRERRRREVQPIEETIARCLEMVRNGKRGRRKQSHSEADAYEKRFADIQDFCNGLDPLFNLMSKAGRGRLKPVAKMLAKLAG